MKCSVSLLCNLLCNLLCIYAVFSYILTSMFVADDVRAGAGAREPGRHGRGGQGPVPGGLRPERVRPAVLHAASQVRGAHCLLGGKTTDHSFSATTGGRYPLSVSS